MSLIPNEVVIGLWGLLGGIMRSLNNAVQLNRVPSIATVIANVLVAGFCGYVASKFAAKFDPDWAMVAAGMGGYLGTTTIDIAISLITQNRGGPQK